MRRNSSRVKKKNIWKKPSTVIIARGDWFLDGKQQISSMGHTRSWEGISSRIFVCQPCIRSQIKDKNGGATVARNSHGQCCQMSVSFFSRRNELKKNLRRRISFEKCSSSSRKAREGQVTNRTACWFVTRHCVFFFYHTVISLLLLPQACIQAIPRPRRLHPVISWKRVPNKIE